MPRILADAKQRGLEDSSSAVHSLSSPVQKYGPNRQPRASPLHLAQCAELALIAEAELTPKPALVDRRGSGAHRDMSLPTLLRSASVLTPFFAEMARAAERSEPNQALRERLALIGRNAESAMLQATGGSNTHRGAIWVLGLLTAAASLCSRSDHQPSVIAELAGRIASLPDRAAPKRASHGLTVQRIYGVTGARGEASQGFPNVMLAGLPMLRDRRAQGANEQITRIDTLLSIMTRLDDTCLLYRGGREALLVAQRGASSILDIGGAGTVAGMAKMLDLDRELLELNASPGGSADLLAATLFLDSLEHDLNGLPSHLMTKALNGHLRV